MVDKFENEQWARIGEKKEKEEREGFASKRSAQYRTRNLKAIGILSGIGVIVAFACFEFITSTNNVPGAPENAGKLGDEHIHASLLTKIFGDKFDYATPNYQVKTSWIHFENQDGDTIHRHSTGVDLEFLFDSMNIALDDKCFVFPDGRQFCTIMIILYNFISINKKLMIYEIISYKKMIEFLSHMEMRIKKP